MNLRFSGRYFLRISLKFGTNLSCLQFKLEKVLWSKEHVNIINTSPTPPNKFWFLWLQGVLLEKIPTSPFNMRNSVDQIYANLGFTCDFLADFFYNNKRKLYFGYGIGYSRPTFTYISYLLC